MHTVGVYGTLKQGHGNHNFFLRGSPYLGEAVSYDRYLMVGKGMGFPLLFKWDVAYHLTPAHASLELYEVDDDTLEGLDSLEGHPNWYRREQVPVYVEDTLKIAWVYIMRPEYWTERYEDNLVPSTLSTNTRLFYHIQEW